MNNLKALFKMFVVRRRGAEMMYFDWVKAATLIRETHPIQAFAGLEDDFEWTGAVIYKNNQPRLIDKDGEKPYTFLGSFWAKPVLVLTLVTKEEMTVECFTIENPMKYSCHTYWPKDALVKL
ncbi:MAG: hypothetical protein LM550_15240 [Candidatus Contendobacter sp.]|jgi:hypothetical protein|nr:hypothetical protein [Gammaproteobacteria bacterium]MCC8995007.1 hypothetical protein [Candidatus Contendobacter sp.]